MKIVYPFAIKWCNREVDEYTALSIKCRCSSSMLYAEGKSNVINNNCACADENGRVGSRVNIG
jgi:hypothetical protein